MFVADQQRRGRGRLGRQWVAPARSSLLLSIVLRRPLEPVDLTALCSVSVVGAIGETTGLHAQVKWPNDVMMRDRKVCGILTEVVHGPGGRTAIVGIGLNVNLDPSAAALPSTATSLSHELGGTVSRRRLFDALTRQIDGWLAIPDTAVLLAGVRSQWHRLLWRREQTVRVAQDGASVTGVVEGMASSGALILRTVDGGHIEVAVGDVFAP